MKRMKKSLGHAKDGLLHAVSQERNLQLFLYGYVLLLLLGLFVRLLAWEWLALLLSGGLFVTTEMINTALERLVDVLDDQHKVLGRKSYHDNIRATKDVAAGASLVSLLLMGIVTVIVFWPYGALYL